MKKPTILIFNVDEALRKNLVYRLFRHGIQVVEVPDNSDSPDCFKKATPGVVIVCAAKKTAKDELKTIKKIRRQDKTVPIILITRYSSEERVITALRAGVNDYFKLPYSPEAILQSIERFLSDDPCVNILNPTGSGASSENDQVLIGASKPMREVKQYLMKVARTDSTVLITGETGTGKELVAELIHLNSERSKKPLVCVNCAAIPDTLVESELFGHDRGAFTGAVELKKGKFEIAGKGTVFLDEIGDMQPFAQAKILRSIEKKEVFHLGGKNAIPMFARVLAATNRDPERMMSEGIFRKDLYYRLNVARLNMPPLRKRKEDIPNLIDYAIRKNNDRFNCEVEGLNDESMNLLLRYDWPGNVRELMNLVEATYINLPSARINVMDLPRLFIKRVQDSEKLPPDERRQIVSTLLETNWNKSTAAQKLKWSRMTLYRKIAKYNIVEERNPAR